MSPHIPPEILQTIFRELTLYDLLRCQCVCKTWNAYLPGDDAALRSQLWLQAGFADEVGDESEESEEEDAKNGDEEKEKTGDEDDEESEAEENENNEDEENDESDGDDDEEKIPRLIIRLEAPVIVMKIDGKLPQLIFGLDVKFDEDPWNSDFECVVDFNGYKVFHPMVNDLENFMHLINPYFHESEDEESKIPPCFAFQTFRELGQKTRLPEDHEYDDGSWKNMLMCQPPVEQVQVEFRWRHEGLLPSPKRTYTTTYREGKGVTVGQVVARVRRMLAHAEEDVRSFSTEMSIFCENCGKNEDCDPWD